jgi:sulfonate transport system ATP-binding protein
MVDNFKGSDTLTSMNGNHRGIVVEGLVRTFKGDIHAVDGIDLEVAPGEIVAIVGASGCGKSTVLRLIAGLDRPTRGEVLVDGHAVDGIERRCAVVFQEPRLLPWRTLAGNVALGLPPGTGRAAGREEVLRWLEVVVLREFAGHRPRQVSGGMAQRTALARALVRRPGVLLLDEPFAALDALTRLRMQDLLDDVQRGAGTTVLLVTHDVDEALRLADRVVLLGGADGAESNVRTVLDVPGARPRDRGDPRLAELRADLLARLGVPRRTPTTAAPEENDR